MAQQKPPMLRSWRCTQPRAAKATAGVAVVCTMASIARVLLSCDPRCWRADLGVRHADLRGEATAVLAKAASPLLYDTAVWYLVWVCGRVSVCFVSIEKPYLQDGPATNSCRTSPREGTFSPTYRSNSQGSGWGWG